MNPVPLPTQYAGVTFRSRLEARWAVFFDALGITWDYEREGYELEDGSRYLPDFWLPDTFGGTWFEVKAEHAYERNPEDWMRAYRFGSSQPYAMIIVQGTPWEAHWTCKAGSEHYESKQFVNAVSQEMSGSTDAIKRASRLARAYTFWRPTDRRALPIGGAP